MIDSIGLFVPISVETFLGLSERSILTQRIDKSTGSIEFEYNNFQTSYSWNYRVIWKMSNEHWVYDPGLKVAVLQEGSPYLRFEFSVPKIIYGHNLFSCDWADALIACEQVRAKFIELCGVEIPDIKDWYCYRVDTCANFLLENIEQVKSYIRYLQRFDYPRRLSCSYKDTGIYFASTHNTLKVYCKGLEFKRHDVCRFVNEIEKQKLQNFANIILRVEIENKLSLRAMRQRIEEKNNQFFRNVYKGYLTLFDTILLFDGVKEMQRIMSKFLVGSETKVMRNLDVFDILQNEFGDKAARSYYAIYTAIILHGQNEAKRRVKRRTYCRACSVFRSLGISLIVSDMKQLEQVIDLGFPSDFSLTMSPDNKYYQFPRAA